MKGFTNSIFLVGILLFSNITFADSTSRIDYSAWEKYGNHLKDCKAGTFQLPDPFEIAYLTSAINMALEDQNTPKIPQNEIEELYKSATVTYNIVGLEQDKCLIKVVKQIKSKSIEKMQNPMTIDCHVEKDHLPLLSKNAYQIAAQKYDFSTNDPLILVLGKACN